MATLQPLAFQNTSRPEPFIYSGGTQDEPAEDVFHFISYLPYNGCLYELDGLKKGPINLGNNNSAVKFRQRAAAQRSLQMFV